MVSKLVGDAWFFAGVLRFALHVALVVAALGSRIVADLVGDDLEATEEAKLMPRLLRPLWTAL